MKEEKESFANAVFFSQLSPYHKKLKKISFTSVIIYSSIFSSSLEKKNPGFSRTPRVLTLVLTQLGLPEKNFKSVASCVCVCAHARARTHAHEGTLVSAPFFQFSCL